MKPSNIECGASPIELRTIDVPQADTLHQIRKVVEGVAAGHVCTRELTTHTGFSERHVRYRLGSAKILGLIRDDLSLTKLGTKLLRSQPGTQGEKQVFRQAIADCKLVRLLVPDFLRLQELDRASLSLRIQLATGLSPATADRRAQVLDSWRRQILQGTKES